MPATKKRTLEETDANAQREPAASNKKSKPDQEGLPVDDETPPPMSKEHEEKHKEIEKIGPHEYIVIHKPLFVFKQEASANPGDNENDDADDSDDEDDPIYKKYREQVEKDKAKVGLLASKYPEHKWVMLKDGQKQYNKLRQMAAFTNPDLLGMYIYNDFHSYGVLELMDNTLLAFNVAYNKKPKDEARLRAMWAAVSAFAHFLKDSSSMAFYMADDADRVQSTANTFGVALLTALHEFDKANVIKPDSIVKDMDLVLAMSISGWHDLDTEWYGNLAEYTKKAELSFDDIPGFQPDDFESAGDGGLDKGSGADPWGWKKAWTEHKRHTIIKGNKPTEQYNILKMSRKERASYAFDKKDPLAGAKDKDIKEGNLWIG